MNTKINDKDFEQMKCAFKRVYNSLVSKNFCQGGTAGMAQKKALDQMSAFVSHKTEDENPFNEYLKELNAKNRVEMSAYIEHSIFSNEVFKNSCFANDEAVNNVYQGAVKEFKSGLEQFFGIYRKYQDLETERQQSIRNIMKMTENKKWLSK